MAANTVAACVAGGAFRSTCTAKPYSKRSRSKPHLRWPKTGGHAIQQRRLHCQRERGFERLRFGVWIRGTNQPERSRPTQAATVFAAMNPQLAAYNPLASSTAQAPGKPPVSPPWRARSFSEAPSGWPPAVRRCCSICAPSHSPIHSSALLSRSRSPALPGVNLCGQQSALPPHTRAAYIWANRVPNIAAPAIHIGDADFIPASQKTPLPVEVPGRHGNTWIARANGPCERREEVSQFAVVKLGNQQALELDLTKAKLPPGDYKLTGFWDWTPFQAVGIVHVRRSAISRRRTSTRPRRTACWRNPVKFR